MTEEEKDIGEFEEWYEAHFITSDTVRNMMKLTWLASRRTLRQKEGKDEK